MKQHERRQKTMEQLMRSVKALIAEKGCDAITMKDIMDRSGLSKGAIFHYIDSKEELFAKVLEERLEEINERFIREVEAGAEEASGPMSQIASGFSDLEDGGDITNKVLAYLAGKSSQPAVSKVLHRYYEASVRYSVSWIEAGQQKGVIPPEVEAAKASELFVLLSFGMRLRAVIGGERHPAFGIPDYTAMIERTLGIDTNKEE